MSCRGILPVSHSFNRQNFCLHSLGMIYSYVNIVIFILYRSMVGIPFRKPDRKAERKVMSLRRNLLAKALKVVGDKGKDVTELAVMLHFQKVKGLAVTGKELMDCLPSLISFERAIPKEVGEALCILAKQLSSGERVSSELIHKVRCDCLGGNT